MKIELAGCLMHWLGHFQTAFNQPSREIRARVSPAILARYPNQGLEGLLRCLLRVEGGQVVAAGLQKDSGRFAIGFRLVEPELSVQARPSSPPRPPRACLGLTR